MGKGSVHVVAAYADHFAAIGHYTTRYHYARPKFITCKGDLPNWLLALDGPALVDKRRERLKIHVSPSMNARARASGANSASIQHLLEGFTPFWSKPTSGPALRG